MENSSPSPSPKPNQPTPAPSSGPENFVPPIDPFINRMKKNPIPTPKQNPSSSLAQGSEAPSPIPLTQQNNNIVSNKNNSLAPIPIEQFFEIEDFRTKSNSSQAADDVSNEISLCKKKKKKKKKTNKHCKDRDIDCFTILSLFFISARFSKFIPRSTKM